MKNETLGTGMLACVLFAFLMGSTVISPSGKAGQDMWISMLLALLVSVPLFVLYGRLLRLCPGMSFFEMSEWGLGQAAGRLVNLLMVWYALHVGAMVLRELSEFAKITSLHQTPMLVLQGTALALAVYLAKSGGQVLGRFAMVAAPVTLLVFVVSFLLSIENMDPSNFQPVLDHTLPELADSAWGFFANPLAEVVLLLCLGGMIRRGASPSKALALGLGVGAFCILVNWARILMVIGPYYMEEALYAQYLATRTIDIGEVITHIEGITSITYHLVAMVKVAVCVMAGALGISKLLRFQNVNLAVVPSGLLVLMLSSALYNNVLEVVGFLGVYRYYALPFQVLLPVAVWVGVEVRRR